MTVRRWLTLFVAAAVIVVVGLVRSPEMRPPDHWVAARDLPQNHQLERADLVGPVSRFRLSTLDSVQLFVGRHLIAARKKGDSISTSDLAATTRFAAGAAGSRVAIYKLGADDYLGLAVPQGAWVVPCYARPGANPADSVATRCSPDALFVEAVHRKIAPADDSWIALRVPSCCMGVLGEYLARDHHFLMLAAAPATPP